MRFEKSTSACLTATLIRGLLTERPHLGIPTIHQAVQERFAGQEIPGQSSIRRYVSNWRDEHKSLIQYVISEEEEKAASNLIEMASLRQQRPLLVIKQEKYEQL